MQFKEINKFIYEKIKEYNTKFKEYSMAFSSLRFTRHKGKRVNDENVYIFKNPLFGILENKDYIQNAALENKMFELYGFEQNRINISGSEFLKNVTVADYGNLFNTSVAFVNLGLMFPKSLTEVFNNDKERMKDIMEKDKQQDKCSLLVIAKKYYSPTALLDDNEKAIYYDREFDTTNYEIIEEKSK